VVVVVAVSEVVLRRVEHDACVVRQTYFIATTSARRKVADFTRVADQRCREGVELCGGATSRRCENTLQI
jgi:hypothetical protein